jgi:hypoxanthine phosphoribosyltransferase
MAEEQLKKVRYSYDQIHQIVKEMAQNISKNCKVDLIISIATGGWIPARILRTFLPYSSDLPLPLFSIGIVNYDSKDRLLSETLIVQRLPEKLDLQDKNVLIVDEVADSGGTFLKAVEYIKSLQPKNLYTGVLHLKEQSSFKPDFVGEFAGNNWIVYPWDAK